MPRTHPTPTPTPTPTHATAVHLAGICAAEDLVEQPIQAVAPSIFLTRSVVEVVIEAGIEAAAVRRGERRAAAAAVLLLGGEPSAATAADGCLRLQPCALPLAPLLLLLLLAAPLLLLLLPPLLERGNPVLLAIAIHHRRPVQLAPRRRLRLPPLRREQLHRALVAPIARHHVRPELATTALPELEPGGLAHRLVVVHPTAAEVLDQLAVLLDHGERLQVAGPR